MRKKLTMVRNPDVAVALFRSMHGENIKLLTFLVPKWYIYNCAIGSKTRYQFLLICASNTWKSPNGGLPHAYTTVGTTIKISSGSGFLPKNVSNIRWLQRFWRQCIIALLLRVINLRVRISTLFLIKAIRVTKCEDKR